MIDNDTTKRMVQFSSGTPIAIDNDGSNPWHQSALLQGEDSEYEEVEDSQIEEIHHLYRIEVIDHSDGVPLADPESLQFVDTELSLPIPRLDGLPN